MSIKFVKLLYIKLCKNVRLPVCVEKIDAKNET
jgi:hypothetical protein